MNANLPNSFAYILPVCLIFLLATQLNAIEEEEEEDEKEDIDEIAPDQFHLSVGSNSHEMIVTWTTWKSIPDIPILQWGQDPQDLYLETKAEVQHFVEDNADFYMYRARMHSLNPENLYYYQVKSNDRQSKVFEFRPLNPDPSFMPTFAIFGDMGYNNQASVPFLTKDVEAGRVNIVFHIGDFAYDLYTDDGEMGHHFFRSIEKIASKVPYMACAGNHEWPNNFSHYQARFSMIGDHRQDLPLQEQINNQFYSFDYGPAHIIVYSSEIYYFTVFGFEPIERQYRFMEEDLKKANRNRALRPWIIVMAHRGQYCLCNSVDHGSCNLDAMERETLRNGVQMNNEGPLKYGLEELFYKYGVDLEFYGHEHYYARFLPMQNYTSLPGFSNWENPYENPRGPVHIITGSAGCWEKHSTFNPRIEKSTWVANHFKDYGYTRVVFKSRKHVVLEQISVEKNGSVEDKIDIIKSFSSPIWM